MAKSKNRQKHQSGNPLKRQEQNKATEKVKKPFPAVPVIIGVVALILIIAVSVVVFDYFNTENLLDKKYYIDEKSDNVVVTLISGADVNKDADTFLNSGGVTKVRINEDNSFTALMTMERYNKLKEDITNAVSALPVISVSEISAIRSYEAQEDNTVLNITVDDNVETLETEVNNILYVIRFYQMCMFNNDAKITVNYILKETGQNYMTEVYDINGNKLETQLIESTNAA